MPDTYISISEKTSSGVEMLTATFQIMEEGRPKSEDQLQEVTEQLATILNLAMIS